MDQIFSRRNLLVGAVGAMAFRNGALDLVEELVGHTRTTNLLLCAEDEDFWVNIRGAFDLDQELTMLNNGGVCPSPRSGLESVRREMEFDNRGLSYRRAQTSLRCYVV